MITGIEHVAIATFNREGLAAWYIRTLNFRTVLQTDSTTYLCAGKGVVLELVNAEKQTPLPQLRDAGLRHIALSVDTFDETCAHLEAAGVRFVDQPIVIPGMRLRFFRDPEGNFLHLIERDVPLDTGH